MAPSTFMVTVSSVSQPLFSGEAISLSVPGTEGELTILPHHAPFITRLKKGEVRVTREQGTVAEIFPVEGGLLEVSNNQATVLL